ncbi:hypothetical protein EVAR_21933_1 [Eumeta japonica]|uniref:Uncharacterized protein n=1 Tax=Eumeta variegata TaxID=151549 RepID=A0A4C1XF51_EUMVA|nr:hypothetical protein EVAR_21933_1 [Eumeta japonica]
MHVARARSCTHGCARALRAHAYKVPYNVLRDIQTIRVYSFIPASPRDFHDARSRAICDLDQVARPPGRPSHAATSTSWSPLENLSSLTVIATNYERCGLRFATSTSEKSRPQPFPSSRRHVRSFGRTSICQRGRKPCLKTVIKRKPYPIPRAGPGGRVAAGAPGAGHEPPGAPGRGPAGRPIKLKVLNADDRVGHMILRPSEPRARVSDECVSSVFLEGSSSVQCTSLSGSIEVEEG